MKKILILYPGFPHYRKGIIDELKRSNDKQFVFVGDKNNYIKSIKPYAFNPGDNFHHVPSFRLGTFVFHKNLIKFLIFNRFDDAIVHSSPYYITILISVFILKIKNVKVYNWCHGIINSRKSLKNYVYYYFFKIFDGLLLYSHYAKENLLEFGYPKNRMMVINNSLDYEEQIKFRNSLSQLELATVKQELFFNADYPQLLFIGRLTKQKKINYLIQAVKLLRDNQFVVNLLIVGDGEVKRELKEQVEELNIANQVNFYGASYDEHTNHKLIASSDCCVAPGEVGLTAIHSLMYGTPVITHDDFDFQMPEAESIIPGFTGDFFEKDNVEDLAEKIKDLVELKHKKENRLKQNCYNHIDKYFTPKYQIKIINKILQD